MTDANAPDVEAAGLRLVVISAFSGAPRPSIGEMLRSLPEVVTPSRHMSWELASLDARLTGFEWAEVHLANFRTDDSLISEAGLARSAFEQLSSRGVGYYAPAALLIVLEAGQSAAFLLGFSTESGTQKIRIELMNPRHAGHNHHRGQLNSWS
jgi:hypothetical protein